MYVHMIKVLCTIIDDFEEKFLPDKGIFVNEIYLKPCGIQICS